MKRTITLSKNLRDIIHTLQLYKLSNNTSANFIYHFEISGTGELLDPQNASRRKIEFYGNSITAGHGVDVATGAKESGAAQYYNNYHTYAAITARHFQAQFSFVARGGIGIMVSWFPEIMPEIYDRLDPSIPEANGILPLFNRM